MPFRSFQWWLLIFFQCFMYYMMRFICPFPPSFLSILALTWFPRADFMYGKASRRTLRSAWYFGCHTQRSLFFWCFLKTAEETLCFSASGLRLIARLPETTGKHSPLLILLMGGKRGGMQLMHWGHSHAYWGDDACLHAAWLFLCFRFKEEELFLKSKN